MKSSQRVGLTIALLGLVVTGPTLSAGEPTINPTGRWKVIMLSTNSQARPAAQDLKLKLDGGRLTGTLSYYSGPVVHGKAPVSELPITKAKLQGDEISFRFTHPPAYGKGPNTNYSYQGKLSGNTINGTVTTEWMDHTSTRNWQAERLKE